ncbi:MAG: ribonuclease D [Thermoanaerobaculia bacterium]|nr:ribonuclease D [Thermoanaerobaculia bacterium]
MIWIERQDDLNAELKRVGKEDEIAIDTEADSFHSYFDKVCLIQLTAGERDVLIDPLAAIDIAPLGRILEDRSVSKVLHGADYDVRILGRDFDIQIRNLVDTMICAQLLGEPAVGLASLLKKYFGVELDKAHQRADWSRRPLPDPMREYAVEDTRHLLQLAALLRKKLEEKGRWAWALEEFERLEGVRWSSSDDGEGWRKLKKAGRLERRELEILRRLYEWRDHEARRRDVPTFRVISNDALLSIAKESPARRSELGKIRGVSPGLLRRYGSDLLGAVEAGLATPEEKLPEKKIVKPWKRDRRIERIVDKLRRSRNDISRELEIDASVLAPKHLLTAIADRKPETLEDLEEIEAMRKWQIEVAGREFISALS